MPAHIALLGDSIFDNAAYTEGEPDVVTHLARLLADSGRATLLAIDGAVAEELAEQCRRVPPDCSHLVISVGGNDALGCLDLLERDVRSVEEALHLLGSEVARFERAYRHGVGFEFGLGVIDLRFVCSDAADYANPIEPSGTGGAKIARAIAESCGVLAGTARTSVVRAS